MKLFATFAAAALPFLAACSSGTIYHPESKPEKMEFEKDILDAYPGEIRGNIALYTNVGVGWAGIIRSTEAHLAPDGLVHAVTTFEHHYFDWQQDKHVAGAQFSLSPRGEGLFRAEWAVNTPNEIDGIAAAETYAGPGKLGIVYGVPQAVDDGVIVLKYRWIRIIPAENFNTNEFDYGRFGEPFKYLQNASGKPN